VPEMRHGESNQTKQHEQSANQKETGGDGEIGDQQAGLQRPTSTPTPLAPIGIPNKATNRPLSM
jgi:hypothetical protein